MATAGTAKASANAPVPIRIIQLRKVLRLG
jgi:hypothetical protein